MNSNITSIWSFLVAGGPVMIPLGFCSIFALAIVIDRIFLHKVSEKTVLCPGLFEKVIVSLRCGRRDQALNICRTANTPLARIALAVVENTHLDRQSQLLKIRNAGRNESRLLHKNLTTLNLISSISPLLGLLGTVTGMISTFFSVQKVGIGDPHLLSGGIAEALITTATGLVIAIPTLVFYRYFIAQSRKLLGDLEMAAQFLVEAVEEQNILERSYELHQQIQQ